MQRSETRENNPICRRRMLKLTAGAAAGLLMGSHESVAVRARSQLPPNSTTGRPILPIPERLEGSVFHLDMRRGEREFLPGLLTPTKGYNGDFLGPTLVVRSGSNVTLNVTNNIGVTTTTHWHGMHVPAVMDGGPHQRIEPGETWTASFPVLNRAATYWYHPHPHATLGRGAIFDPMGTGYQVYEGLAGMLIVEDGMSDTIPLPRSYGQDDIPLILQDRRFNDDGSLMHFPSDFNAATDPALRKGRSLPGEWRRGSRPGRWCPSRSPSHPERFERARLQLGLQRQPDLPSGRLGRRIPCRTGANVFGWSWPLPSGPRFSST